MRISAIVAQAIFVLLLTGCATYTPLALPEENIKFNARSEKAVVILSTRVANKQVPEPHLVFATYDPKMKGIPGKEHRDKVRRFAVKAKMGVFVAPDRTGWAQHSLLIEPGTYVLAAAKPPAGHPTAYRLNSIYFTARPGDVLYIGDYEFSLSDQYVINTTLSRNDAHAKLALKTQPKIKKAPKFFTYKQTGRFEMQRMQLMSGIKIDPSAK